MWYQLATYECYWNQSRFLIMCFQLVTIMYVRYCRKEPVHSFFLLCASSQPRPCKYIYVFVKEVQSVFQYAIIYMKVAVEENQCIFIYYLFLASHDHVCTFLRSSVFFLAIYFQLATTMSKRCCPSDPVFIFIMRFLPSTTMYDRYCRREPVYFFIMCFYLATAMYVRSCQRGPVNFVLCVSS